MFDRHPELEERAVLGVADRGRSGDRSRVRRKARKPVARIGGLELQPPTRLNFVEPPDLLNLLSANRFVRRPATVGREMGALPCDRVGESSRFEMLVANLPVKELRALD